MALAVLSSAPSEGDLKQQQLQRCLAEPERLSHRGGKEPALLGPGGLLGTDRGAGGEISGTDRGVGGRSL